MKYYVCLLLTFFALSSQAQELNQTEITSETELEVLKSDEATTTEIVIRSKPSESFYPAEDGKERYRIFVFTFEKFPFIYHNNLRPNETNQGIQAFNSYYLRGIDSEEKLPLETYRYEYNVNQTGFSLPLPEQLDLLLLSMTSVIELKLNSEQLAETTTKDGLTLSVKLRNPKAEEIARMETIIKEEKIAEEKRIAAAIEAARVDISSSGNDPFLRSKAEELIRIMVQRQNPAIPSEGVFVHNGMTHLAGAGWWSARGTLPSVAGPRNNAPAVADAVAHTSHGTYRVVIFSGADGTYEGSTQLLPHPLSGAQSSASKESIPASSLRRSPLWRNRGRN